MTIKNMISLKAKVGLIVVFAAGFSFICYCFGVYPEPLVELGRQASLLVVGVIWVGLLAMHFSIILWDQKMSFWLSLLFGSIYIICINLALLTLHSDYSAIGIVGALSYLVLRFISDRRGDK